MCLGFTQYPHPQQQYPPGNQIQYPPAGSQGQPYQHDQYNMHQHQQMPPQPHQGYPNYPPPYSQPGYGQVIQHQPNVHQQPPQVVSGMFCIH